MKEHAIKLSHVFFDDVISGVKTFELRKDDRNYQVGDMLVMSEVLDDKLTGRVIRATIIYKLDGYLGLVKDYCILGINYLGGIE